MAKLPLSQPKLRAVLSITDPLMDVEQDGNR